MWANFGQILSQGHIKFGVGNFKYDMPFFVCHAVKLFRRHGIEQDIFALLAGKIQTIVF